MQHGKVRILGKSDGGSAFQAFLAEIASQKLGGPPHRASDFFLFGAVSGKSGEPKSVSYPHLTESGEANLPNSSREAAACRVGGTGRQLKSCKGGTLLAHARNPDRDVKTI